MSDFLPLSKPMPGFDLDTWEKKSSHVPKRTLRSTRTSEASVEVTFFFCSGNEKSREGVGENCAHSAGCVTRGPDSSHHSCSTPTYRHRAGNVKGSAQLQCEQTLANFSAMCRCNQRGSSVFESISWFSLCSIEIPDGGWIVPVWPNMTRTGHRVLIKNETSHIPDLHCSLCIHCTRHVLYILYYY